MPVPISMGQTSWLQTSAGNEIIAGMVNELGTDDVQRLLECKQAEKIILKLL